MITVLNECRLQQHAGSLPLCLAGEPYEFVPLEWLKKWLDDSTATKEMDNSHFLCSHGKLHPDKVGEAKRISQRAAQILHERYGGGPRLDRKSSNCHFSVASSHSCSFEL